MRAQAEGERASRSERESIDAVTAIVLLWAMEQALAARLAAGGLDSSFVGVAVAMAEELDQHLAESPPDLRRFEWVTPEHKRQVEAGAAALSLVKQSATDAARAMRDGPLRREAPRRPSR